MGKEEGESFCLILWKLIPQHCSSLQKISGQKLVSMEYSPFEFYRFSCVKNLSRAKSFADPVKIFEKTKTFARESFR